MNLTNAQIEFYDFIKKADFISMKDYNYFGDKLKNEGNEDTLLHGLLYTTKFIRVTNSNPDLDGIYRVGFLGKIINSKINWSGYLDTGTYFIHQLKCVKYFGMNTIGVFTDGDKDPSILTMIIGFLLGVIIRLPIGILLTIIQLIVVLTQSKEKKSASLPA